MTTKTKAKPDHHGAAGRPAAPYLRGKNVTTEKWWMKDGFLALADGDPSAMLWLQKVVDAVKEFPPDPDELPEDKFLAAQCFNSMLQRGLRLHQANDEFGFTPTSNDFRQNVIEIMAEQPKREMSWGENLCLSAAIFHRKGFSFSLSGEKDTPMQKAQVAADVTMRAVQKWEDDGEIGDLADYIEDEHDQHSLCFEAPKKAIARFRTSIVDQHLFHFDAENFLMKVVPHSEVVEGAATPRGRPRKKI